MLTYMHWLQPYATILIVCIKGKKLLYVELFVFQLLIDVQVKVELFIQD